MAVSTVLPAADSGSFAKPRALSPILRHASPTTDSQPKLPAGLNLVDWKQIRAEYERHRHGMFPDGQGGYQSRSHDHRWLVRFDGKGFTVKPDSEAWSWGLELERWGRQGEEVVAGGAVRIHKDVNRLEYRRQGITEWFVNGKEGLEHAFTITHRPGEGEGELSIQLRQRGELVAEQGLVAEQDRDGLSVSYKTAQGGPALRYRKLLVTDARGRRLPARMVADGEWLRILVDDRRAVYPIVVDPITQRAYLKASNTGASDYFGYSVAISGDTVVVGAPLESSNATGVNGTQSDNSAIYAGAAYVFVRSSGSGTWTQQAYLKASNTEASDYFGQSVAISGDTVVVGAYGESSNATGVNGAQSDNSANDAGAAYVFV
ncbi:MAG: FG-GAP repeat protein, partial [Acidobacteria bacterium]|nr:FG-GAP repeat protein [Acidobacteriota bacterium]